jgi:hypothetical protein
VPGVEKGVGKQHSLDEIPSGIRQKMGIVLPNITL